MSTLEENTNPLFNGIMNIQHNTIHLYIRVRVIMFSATFIRERSREMKQDEL
jgi:hypothetical protein